ncbi:hypothetical protein OAO72_03370 [Alphaproteobacteria bacterium]|nr:hypothetical protein [Alphaproteobacteria bacterium]
MTGFHSRLAFIHDWLSFTTGFHSRLAFIHDWLSFTTGFHSRLAFIHDWLSFVIGQRRWFGLVSAIAKTADYDQKQSLESPCRFAYI